MLKTSRHLENLPLVPFNNKHVSYKQFILIQVEGRSKYLVNCKRRVFILAMDYTNWYEIKNYTVYSQKNIISVGIKGLAFSSESSHNLFLYLAIFVPLKKVS